MVIVAHAPLTGNPLALVPPSLPILSTLASHRSCGGVARATMELETAMCRNNVPFTTKEERSKRTMSDNDRERRQENRR